MLLRKYQNFKNKVQKILYASQKFCLNKKCKRSVRFISKDTAKIIENSSFSEQCLFSPGCKTIANH